MGLLSWLLGSKSWTGPNGAVVRYLRTYNKTNGLDGSNNTYEEWSAPNTSAAQAYLNTREIAAKQYYLVVETPAGNWAKDVNGIYQE